MVKYEKIIISLLLTLALLIAVLSILPTIEAKPEELPVIKVGMNAYNIYFAVEYARERGWDKELGIKLEPVYFVAGLLNLQSLVAGEVCISYGLGDAPVYVAASKEMDFRVIGIHVESGSLNNLVSIPEIKSIPELKGKRVGVMKGSMEEMFLRMALSKYDIDPDKDVEIVYMESPEVYAALIAKRIDAGVPHFTHALELKRIYKYNILMTGTDLPKPPKPISVMGYNFIAVNRAWAEKNPDLVVKFLALYYRAMDYYEKDPITLNKYCAEKHNAQHGTNLTDRDINDIFNLLHRYSLEEHIKVLFNPEQPENVWNGARGMCEVFVRLGRINKIPDLKKYIDPSYMKKLYEYKENATLAIENAEKAIQKASEVGGAILPANTLKEQAKEALNKYNYWVALDLAKKAIESAETAEKTAKASKEELLKEINTVKESIKEANNLVSKAIESAEVAKNTAIAGIVIAVIAIAIAIFTVITYRKRVR